MHCRNNVVTVVLVEILIFLLFYLFLLGLSLSGECRYKEGRVATGRSRSGQGCEPGYQGILRTWGYGRGSSE